MKYTMRMNEISSFVLLCLCLFSATGCGKAGRIPGLVPAKGIVLYNNIPVEGALLTFIPESPVAESGSSSEQRPATAVTNTSGRFSMMTLQPDDGVFPGKYTIVISKDAPEKVYSNEELQAFFRQGLPTPIPESKNELPGQYSNPATSPLKVDIGSKGDRSLKFEIAD